MHRVSNALGCVWPGQSVWRRRSWGSAAVPGPEIDEVMRPEQVSLVDWRNPGKQVCLWLVIFLEGETLFFKGLGVFDFLKWNVSGT